MTTYLSREDIIRMALDAGLQYRENLDEVCTPYCDGVYMDELEKFAALVAAAEREKVAKWMARYSYATGHGDTLEDLLQELNWQVREAEREECIALYGNDDVAAPVGNSAWGEAYQKGWTDGTQAYRDAIRARGQ